MEMDRPHANVLEQRTGNRKFIWNGLTPRAEEGLPTRDYTGCTAKIHNHVKHYVVI